MILIIDNYDSFTWNLVDLIRQGPYPVEVRRNDEIDLVQAKALSPKGILISPGPGRPEDSGVSVELVKEMAGETPIFGVCLGHQLLGELFGMKLRHAPAPVHGKTSRILHDGKGIFRDIPQEINVMRYHSLVLEKPGPDSDILVSARTPADEIMGIRHIFLNFAGVQFHPESILTEYGNKMIQNWLEEIG